jgi:4-hydroxybenzoate polyprenyltransferase
VSVFSEKLSALAQLARWDRLVGVWLLLAPAVCGLVLAGAGRPDVKLLVIFTIGAVLMRSAGCVANDLADRNLDGFVARTAMRPLAIGSVSVSAALVLLFILLLAAASLLYFLNLKTILLALAVLPVVLLYPFCKRFMPCPQAVLAIAFAWPVLLAFSAQGATFTLSTWLWFAGVWAWVVAYDTAYAMADRSDDVRVGIKSSAILFGKYDRVFVLALNLITLVCFGLAATLQNLHNAFFLGWLMMLLLFINGWRQIWQRDPEQCFAAFKQNIWIGLAWFVAVVLGFL